MTISGGASDPNNFIGDPSRMSSNVERETAPVLVMNKSTLAISPQSDELDVSFTKMGGNLWKYQANAENPVLAPLVSTMQASSKTDETGDWKDIFDGMVQTLSTKTQKEFADADQKLKEELDSYQALRELLVAAAKTQANIQAAIKPVSGIGAAQKAALINISMSNVASNQLGVVGKQFLEGGAHFLNEVGQNYVHYDKLSNNLTQTGAAFSKMENLLNLEKVEGGG